MWGHILNIQSIYLRKCPYTVQYYVEWIYVMRKKNHLKKKTHLSSQTTCYPKIKSEFQPSREHIWRLYNIKLSKWVTLSGHVHPPEGTVTSWLPSLNIPFWPWLRSVSVFLDALIYPCHPNFMLAWVKKFATFMSIIIHFHSLRKEAKILCVIEKNDLQNPYIYNYKS